MRTGSLLGSILALLSPLDEGGSMAADETRHDHCEFTRASGVGRTGGTAPLIWRMPESSSEQSLRCSGSGGADLQAANSVSTRPTTIEELHQYCAALEQQVTELQTTPVVRNKPAAQSRSGRSSERTVAVSSSSMNRSGG